VRSLTPHLKAFRASCALFAVCALVLGGLAVSASAQAQPPCPAGMRCGSVTVPLDRQNPSAGTIDIHYALVPHTDTARPAVGTIVPNPGGPGQAAIASAGIYLRAMAPLRRDRDLLLIPALRSARPSPAWSRTGRRAGRGRGSRPACATLGTSGCRGSRARMSPRRSHSPPAQSSAAAAPASRAPRGRSDARPRRSRCRGTRRSAGRPRPSPPPPAAARARPATAAP
jgi:hypothetical protein